MKKVLIPLVIVLILCVGLPVIGYNAFWNWYNEGIKSRPSDSTESVEFEVRSGDTAAKLAPRLKEAGLIADENIYTLYLQFENKGDVIKAGKFLIPRNSTIPEILGIISKLESAPTVKVTLIEGWRSDQMAERLDNNFRTFIASNSEVEVKFNVDEFKEVVKNPDNYEFGEKVSEFLGQHKPAGKPLEGFLYPNTYEFIATADARAVAERLIIGFMDKTKDVEKSNDFYDQLTLASIVERESLSNAERPIIAGIFQNRLDQNFPLQSDATVNYATGKSTPRPTFQDLQVNSPYNTYKNVGLTPTPISNPRLESIQAAVNPADTEYFYFIHEQEGAGTAHYAKTLSEHNKNVCLYLDRKKNC